MSRVQLVDTTWIDRAGSAGNLDALPGPHRSETANFALHTLGWIRLTRIRNHLDVSFDPRAVTVASVSALTCLLLNSGAGHDHLLVRLEAYTGRGWVHIQDDRISALLEFLDHMLDFAKSPAVPTALLAQPISADRFGDLSGRARAFVSKELERRALWGSPMPFASVQTLFEAEDLGQTEAVKIVERSPVGRQLFARYRASKTTVWADEDRGHFQGAPIDDVVPDRALASNVIQALDRVMANGMLLFEHLTGPVLTSSGEVGAISWIRLVLPLEPREDRARALVLTHRYRSAEVSAA
jgi:hypothetical protein